MAMMGMDTMPIDKDLPGQAEAVTPAAAEVDASLQFMGINCVQDVADKREGTTLSANLCVTEG